MQIRDDARGRCFKRKRTCTGPRWTCNENEISDALSRQRSLNLTAIATSVVHLDILYPEETEIPTVGTIELSDIITTGI